LHNAR